MDINEIIKKGEDSRTEFKSSDFHNDSLAKEIAAFSNMKGGSLFIGISDSGVIQGIEDTKLDERVINICRNNIIPPVIPEISFIHVQEKKILHLVIEKGKFKPYKVKSTNKYYIRAGSVSIEPTNEELIRLFQNGSQLHFEVSRLPGTGINDIDLLKFRLYCQEYRDIEVTDNMDFKKLLYNFQVIDEDEQLSFAGALFFAKKISRLLPQSGIDMNLFNGPDMTDEIADYKSFEGHIPEAISSAENFVKFNSRIKAGFNKEETRRIDRHDYDPFAIRELVTNAFMHRDWSIFGQKIRVNMFSDRLEIFSPGRIPNTLNLTRALAGISYYRNPIIAQMLKDYKFAEKAGRGLQKILKFYRENKLKPPDFELTDEFLKVILYNANEGRT
ncbi:Schlafen and ATP-dependent DNA helicase domains-containing protein [Desulfonema limicola]|uniref:Schlafen and ATP-dependent DNA helicase domains-containing protein n=1 Tax=Desulfonema limicola TaxID=45656 RepID=A0A975GJY6_9BACT|nr:RNA-binding domain-containing protein [Desulfonema limicola]QTA83278.1 Schlafen and ATP-dependent DNA helicase domains-containing protein [Desulfonema limicola]